VVKPARQPELEFSCQAALQLSMTSAGPFHQRRRQASEKPLYSWPRERRRSSSIKRFSSIGPQPVERSVRDSNSDAAAAGGRAWDWQITSKRVEELDEIFDGQGTVASSPWWLAGPLQAVGIARGREPFGWWASRSPGGTQGATYAQARQTDGGVPHVSNANSKTESCMRFFASVSFGDRSRNQSRFRS
jgi:hypothetical protein